MSSACVPMRSRRPSNAGCCGCRISKRRRRSPARLLVFCDEDAPVADPAAALASARGASSLAVLVGPEGGFAEDERTMLLGLPHSVRLALGPRILRADTAAVAALALVGAVLGDWR